MSSDRGTELFAIGSTFYALSCIFTALRIYVRIHVSKNWGIDDALLLATLASYTAYAGCGFLGIKYGIGKTTGNLTLEEVPRALYFWFICELLYTTTTVLLRLSISVFLFRICEKKIHKIIIWATMIVVIVFSIFYFFLAIFQCSPVSYFWNKFAGEEGSCIDPTIFPIATYAHSAVSAAADWVLGLLPIWVVWDLKMNFRTKVSVAIVLSLGMIAGMATLIRIPFIRVLGITDEFLYAIVDVGIWSFIEPGLGTIAASACTLRPLFRNFYHLSKYGTYAANSQNHTHPSAWANGRNGYVRNTSTATASNARRSHEEGDIEIGLEAIREGKSTPTVTHRDLDRNSSKEELTGTTGKSKSGIRVLKTVQIERHGRDSIGQVRFSQASDESLVWPRK